MRRVIGAAERAAWTEFMLVASRLARTATRMASRAGMVQCFTAVLLLSISGLCIECIYVVSRGEQGCQGRQKPLHAYGVPASSTCCCREPVAASDRAVQWGHGRTSSG